jgi:hypothetical protein
MKHAWLSKSAMLLGLIVCGCLVRDVRAEEGEEDCPPPSSPFKIAVDEQTGGRYRKISLVGAGS